MKTLIVTALIATASLTAAATAQTIAAGPQAAIAHFNSDLDSTNDRVMLQGNGNVVAVSTRSGALANTFDHFNGDKDSNNDLRGLNGATVAASSTGIGGDILARIRAEGLENE